MTNEETKDALVIEKNGTEEKKGNEDKAKSFFNRAKEGIVKALDKNDDGELNLKDVSIIAGAVGNVAKKSAIAVKGHVVKGSEQLNAKLEQNRIDSELRALAPIFQTDLDSPDFLLPKLIRVTDMDKRHSESELCKDSIGHYSYHKELRVINLYRNKLDYWGLSFSPDIDSDVYYVDPSDRDQYIAIDGYFTYLKVARISELQRIANELGAKHFKITYKLKKTTAIANHGKGQLGGKIGANKANIDIEHSSKQDEYESMDVMMDMECVGHSPVQPTLRYLQKEAVVRDLIAMRMSNNPMLHQKLSIMLYNSSGIKTKDAGNIDAYLNSLKLQGSVSISSEAQKEERSILEYEIDF